MSLRRPNWKINAGQNTGCFYLSCCVISKRFHKVTRTCQNKGTLFPSNNYETVFIVDIFEPEWILINLASLIQAKPLCSTVCTPPYHALRYRSCSPSIRCRTTFKVDGERNALCSLKHWIHYKHFALHFIYSNRYKQTSTRTVYSEILRKTQCYFLPPSLLKVKTQPCTILRHFEDQQNTSTLALNVKRDKIHFTASEVARESMYIVMRFLFIHALVKQLLQTCKQEPCISCTM